MATRKQIDQARETRLWLTGIVAPILMTGIILAANEDVRWLIKNGVQKIKSKFSKKQIEE